MLAVKLFGRPRAGGGHTKWSFKQAIDRTLDVAIATVAIGFILPLAGFISLLIFLEDPGPILTRHRGACVNGRQLDMLRFRTQLVDADTRLEEYLTHNRDEYVRYYLGETLHHDPRFSMVGSVLYRTGLEDIPMLVNVVGGQLPITGHYSWGQVLAWLRAQSAVEPDHLG
jgi:exopolysaccharide production protein ExoY